MFRRFLCLAFATALGIASLGGTSATGAEKWWQGPTPQPKSGPVAPVKPAKPAPNPKKANPVVTDFEIGEVTAAKLRNGEKGLTFEVSMVVKNAKGRKLIYVGNLMDKNNKPLLEDGGEPFTIAQPFTPQSAEDEVTIKFELTRAFLEEVYGAKAKEFHVEATVMDVTDVKDFDDEDELAKAKMIGKAPEVFHLAIPAEKSTKRPSPAAPEKPAKPNKPAPAPMQVSPVAFDFEAGPSTASKLANGDKAVLFEARLNVDNVKGRKLVFVVVLTDANGKPILDETGKPTVLPYAVTPETDQLNQAITVAVPRAKLEALYGANAKDFHLEMKMWDVTDVKDFNDRNEVAKAKVIGTGPAVFHIAMPTGTPKRTMPALPTDVEMY